MTRTHPLPLTQPLAALAAAAQYLLCRRATARWRPVVLACSLLVWAWPAAVHAQTCTGNVDLRSQADVNAFACSTITGYLLISGNDISDLTPLASLTSVGGTLNINFNPALTSLAGLESVTSVGSFLVVVINSALTSLAGLKNVSTISGGLFIQNNPALTSLAGLESLTSVGTDIEIRSTSLTSLTGLEDITSIGGTLTLLGNTALTNLTGLDNLASVGGAVTLKNNIALTSLAALANLTSIGTDLSVENNDALTSLTGLEAITSITGDLLIWFNEGLTSLAGLNNLASVGALLYLHSNTALPSLADLQSLSSVGGNLTVQFSDMLETCSCGLAGLISGGAFSGVSGTVTIQNNAPTGSCNSPQQVIDTACSLPVELTTFEARADGQTVRLNWQTASETNNAGFEIAQRPLAPEAPGSSPHAPHAAKDAAWNVLGFVPGAGTTTQPQAYAFHVADLAVGTHLFRLRQVDYDGTFAYSPQVEVRLELMDAYQASMVYPNPLQGEARFELALSQPQHVSIAVYDVVGREVARLFDGPLAARTTHRFTLDASRWRSGLYLLRVRGESFASTQPLSLVK